MAKAGVKTVDRVKARRALFERDSTRHGSYAMLQPTRAIAKVSSSALRTVGEATDAQRGKVSRDRLRQAEAYDVIKLIGELSFIINLKANLVARCDFVLQEAKRLEDGGVDWVPTTDERARRVDDGLVGPQGGKAELKRRAAMHLSTGGEFHLLGLAAGDDGSLVWEVLSVVELTIEAAGGVYRKRDGAQREEVDKDNYTARCWRAAADYSDLADSEVLRALPICNQIVRLDQALEAIVDSKLAAQMMYVPNEMSFNDSEDDEGTGTGAAEAAEGEDIDPFTEELVRHLSDPIKDRRSTAALVPLVLRGPADMHDKIHLIDLGRSLDSVYQELRKEALERLFRAVDAPPEHISGKGGLSGLGGGNVAISIDRELVDKYVLPTGELEVDFFTVAYLRPMLETFEGMKPDESQNFRYAFDPSKITSTGDEPKAADRLHQVDLLSDEAHVKAQGFDVADMPSPDELAARRAWELIMASPQVFAPALLNKIPGFENVDLSKLGKSGPGDSAQPALGPGPAALGPGQPDGRFLPASVEMLGRTLLVAADAAVERALERAGARIVGAATRHHDITLRDRIRPVTKTRVLTVLSDADLQAMGFTLPKLFEGEWDTLAVRAKAWIRYQLTADGVEGFEADDRAAIAANMLCTAVHEFVLDHAHTGCKVGANGLRLPDGVVLAALDLLPVG